MSQALDPPSANHKRTTDVPEDLHKDVNGLPLDALTACFRLLDCCSLSRCCCVCRAWNTIANEPDLWREQLVSNYYRPAMLLHYGLLKQSLDATPRQVVADQQSFTSAPTAAGHSPQQTTGAVKLERELRSTAAAAATSHRGVSTSPKQTIAHARVHPPAQHQALLARFHSAMSQIQGWRLLLQQRSPASAQTTAADTAPAETSSPHPINLQQTLHVAAEPQQQPNDDWSSTIANSNNKCFGGVIGHPLPLSWCALTSGKAWAIGCVQHQQQEQSCWVRFNLPAELKLDLQLVQAAADNALAATVQALGPNSVGWFDVITCNPFKMEDEDVDILLQSHKTGFYAWDHSEEDGTDRTEEAEPMPWDNPAGGHAAAPSQGNTACRHAAPAAVQPQQQQQQPGPPSVQPSQQCRLRMLVYIHYEQLLKMLPWQLAQSTLLPCARPPQWCKLSQSQRAALQQPALGKDAALWLHMDVCQLHGGFRLGSCVAPLRYIAMSRKGMHFLASQERVLAALYDPHCSMNCSTSSTLAAQPNKSSLQQQVDAFGSAANAELAAQALTEAGCQLMIIGGRVVHGTQKVGSDGLLLKSVADVIRELLSMDEVMVDFALFDGEGQLLMGRAGVEIWSKEKTNTHVHPAYHAAADQGVLNEVQMLQGIPQQQQQQPLPAAGEAHIAANVGGHPPLLVHTRTVQLLHFLVDNVDSTLWENGIMVDAVPAASGRIFPLLSMVLTHSAFLSLFGVSMQQQQQQQL